MNWEEAIEKYGQFQGQFRVDTKKTAEEKIQSEINGMKSLLDELPEIKKRNIEDISENLWHDEILVKYIKRNRKYYREQADLIKSGDYNQLVRCFVFARDNFECHYCGRDGLNGIPLHKDHVIPRKKGGEGIDNLTCSCSFCNFAKQEYSKDDYTSILIEVAKAVKEKYPDEFY